MDDPSQRAPDVQLQRPEGATGERIAVFVAHGMGQQVEHATIDQVLTGLRRAAEEAGRDLGVVSVSNVGVDGKAYRRASIEHKLSPTDVRVIDVYESYWAPITEGRVTLRDTMRFLVRGGVNGVVNAVGPFRRYMFGGMKRFDERPRFGTWLLMTCAFLAALVAMHALAFIAVVPTGGVSLPGALAHDVTLALVAFLTLTLLMGVRLVLSMRRRAPDRLARPTPTDLRRRLVERVIGMRMFGLLVAFGVAFLLAAAALLPFHLRAFGPPTIGLRAQLLSLVFLVGAIVYVAARWLPLHTRARSLSEDPRWADLARRLKSAKLLLVALALLAVAQAIAIRTGGSFAAWLFTALALGATLFAMFARLHFWKPPEGPTSDADWTIPLTLGIGAAAFTLGPGLTTVNGLALGTEVLLAVGVGTLPALVAPLLIGERVREDTEDRPGLVGARTSHPVQHAGAMLLAALALAGGSALAFRFGSVSLFALILVAWGIVIAGSFAVRHFLVQYVGDVAAYVSPHKLDRFAEMRREIKCAVLERARAVYALEEKGKPAYARVALVGHSLGSVVAYDALNALLVEEALGGSLRVRERTSLLLTFGSPLDKTAFTFATQDKTSPTREALGALVQPLIVDELYRERLEWINVWAKGDIISDPLTLYDSWLYRVENVEDLEASTPLAAHTEYWEDRVVWERLYAHLVR